MVDVSQGVHLQMCSEVLRYLGSDTCFHIRTSPSWLAQRRYRSFDQWHYRIHYYCHAHVPSPDVSQGVNLQMCGEVLWYLGSDTCFHIQTSSLWLAQWCYRGFSQRHFSIQHYFQARVPSPDVSQGVHLQMCGEVLWYLGSNTCFHIQTCPLWLTQRRYRGFAQQHYRIQHYFQGQGHDCVHHNLHSSELQLLLGLNE